jgi:Putative inner membrane exporter, YdcZ
MALRLGRAACGYVGHGADRQQRPLEGGFRRDAACRHRQFLARNHPARRDDIDCPDSVAVAAEHCGTPWWGWLGGALGAVYAVTMVLLARELGAATLTALAVTGQLVCSVMLDHFGWVGFNEHAAGIGRIVGCLLMVAGFFLIARF